MATGSIIFQVILFGLVIYELVALQTNKIPTITETLKGLPLWASAITLAVLVAMLVDHVYFQLVIP